MRILFFLVAILGAFVMVAVVMFVVLWPVSEDVPHEDSPCEAAFERRYELENEIESEPARAGVGPIDEEAGIPIGDLQQLLLQAEREIDLYC